MIISKIFGVADSNWDILLKMLDKLLTWRFFRVDALKSRLLFYSIKVIGLVFRVFSFTIKREREKTK